MTCFMPRKTPVTLTANIASNSLLATSGVKRHDPSAPPATPALLNSTLTGPRSALARAT